MVRETEHYDFDWNLCHLSKQKKKSEKKVAINIVSNLLVNDFMFVKML